MMMEQFIVLSNTEIFNQSSTYGDFACKIVLRVDLQSKIFISFGFLNITVIM